MIKPKLPRIEAVIFLANISSSACYNNTSSITGVKNILRWWPLKNLICGVAKKVSGVSSWRQFVTKSIAQVLFTDAEGFIKVDHTDHIIKGHKTINNNGCSHIIAIFMQDLRHP